MDNSFWLISLPAIVALGFKGAVYAYAHFSKTHNFHTRLYLLALFALSIQNISEIAHFYTLHVRGTLPYFEVTLFYASSIAALALFFHLAIAISFNQPLGKKTSSLVSWIYVYGLLLEALLFLTPWLISGYTHIGESVTGYSVTRIPGPLYIAFEIYAIGISVSVLGMLGYGAKRQDTAYKRTKAVTMLFAIVPMVLVVVAVLGSLHFGYKLFNASFLMPIAITFFLVVTAYAIHQYRLFDIEFYIPWSKVRKRKTAFYDRIRGMIAEIADLGSVNQVVSRLADTLRCPVALVGGNRPVFAAAGDTPALAEFPSDELHKIDHIVVANEIAEAMPRTHALMKQHGVAAIVPFYPHSQTASSWMLLGEAFSEEVYTPRDFRMVEQLFAKLSDLFLDKLIIMRTQLANAQRQARALDQRLLKTEENLAVLQKENRDLREQNTRLMTESTARVRASVLGHAGVDDGVHRGAAEPGSQSVAMNKTLDEYVTEFEAQIIRQTLERCNGNKSKAARRLGLRPNTLHYKLERYGISAGKKNSAGEK
jgi:hypothetical protein